MPAPLVFGTEDLGVLAIVIPGSLRVGRPPAGRLLAADTCRLRLRRAELLHLARRPAAGELGSLAGHAKLGALSRRLRRRAAELLHLARRTGLHGLLAGRLLRDVFDVLGHEDLLSDPSALGVVAGVADFATLPVQRLVSGM